MTVLFDVKPEMSADDADIIASVNPILARLAARRRPKVEGRDYLESKLAWNFASHKESLLYRLVALGSGCALNWNAGNALCSLLAARALIETVASLLYFEKALGAALGKEEPSEVHETILHHSFGTKDKEWLKDHPEHETKSIYTAIDKLEKSYGITGLRAGYDGLSERCHPNAAGHQFFFGTLDHKTATVTYSETKRDEQNLNMVLGAVLLLVLAEASLDRLDQATAKISELQKRSDSQ